MSEQLGVVILLGSGEAAASIRKVYHWLFSRMEPPVRVSILETPAGFEPNSAYVARRIADFLAHRLQNFDPRISVIPARKRNTPHSPNNPDILRPLLASDVIFMGPGSPTYAVRQLQDTLAWNLLAARHFLGAAIILASASTLAYSSYTLPVYEIYKVGEELHWHQGLDFFGSFGLSLVIVPHWNNTEGGETLDTSRCYMGRARFDRLMALLPPKQTVVGIDEHTALVLDLQGQTCQVMGNGSVTLLTTTSAETFAAGQQFPITRLGLFKVPEPQTIVPAEIWKTVRQAASTKAGNGAPEPPPEVLALLEKREAARARKDYRTADKLRDEIATLNWRVMDTSHGPQLQPTADH